MTDQKYEDLMSGGWSYPKKESTDPEEVKKVVDKYLTDNKIDSETIDKKITDGVSKIVADAPEDFDTLKEMSDWISQHSDSAAAMNSDILDNKSSIESLQKDKANATEVETLSGEVENNTNAISEIKANITTNIYNLNDVVNGKWITNKNGSAGDSTSWAYLPLKVKGLKTVTISALGGTASWNKHYFNDNNGTTIEYNNSQVTVNVPSDATILYVNIYSEYTDINSIKITTESVGEIVSAINERTTLNVRLTLEKGDLDENGIPVSSTEYKRTINYIKVKPNTVYTISRSSTSNLYVVGFQAKGIAITDGTATNNKFIVYESTRTNVSFITTNTTQYIKVVMKNLDLSEKISLDLTNSVGETVADNMNIIDDINASMSDYGLNNVFDGEFIKGRYNKTTNIVEYNANFLCCKNKISCNSGDKITLKTTKLFNRFFVHFFNSGTYVSTYDGVYMETARLIDTTIDVPADVDSFIFDVTAHEVTTIASYGHIGVYINNQIDVVKNDVDILKNGKEDKYTLELNYSTKCVNFENVVNADEYFEAMVFDRSDKKKYIKVSGYRPSENAEENEISYINLGSKTLNIVGSNNQTIMFSGGSEIYDAYITAIR